MRVRAARTEKPTMECAALIRLMLQFRWKNRERSLGRSPYVFPADPFPEQPQSTLHHSQFLESASSFLPSSSTVAAISITFLNKEVLSPADSISARALDNNS